MSAACPKCAASAHDPGQRFCSRCGEDLRPRSVEDEFDGLVGKIVDARYKVLGRIGVGGMGIVYRVEHVRMGKVAAMKVLRRDVGDDAQATKRFVNEVEMVSKLDHPNIVQTFDFGEWHGLLYLVMELVRGEDLAVVVRREGALPLQRALPLFVQVCRALDEAHHAGIIHRDLKPDNIVVARRREGEHVKVLDFGLAKLRERAGLAEVTGAGSLVGTPYYMAPEQVRSEAISERTDLYALGATIYRVVTGTPAFQGDTPMAILSRHLTDPVVPPSERLAGLPLELDHLVLKAMAKDPANRFESARQMREAIEAISTAHVESAPLPSWDRAPLPEPGSEGAQRSAITKVEVPSANDEAFTAAVDDSDPLARLRREDIDSFESGLRWRRRLVTLLGPALLLVALWGGWRLYTTVGAEPGVTENEPNDSAATANLPPNGTPLYGHIGPTADDGTPDFDYFRVPAGKGPRSVFAAVSGLSELNLVVELFDVTGALITKVDGGGEGRGEVLGPWALASPNEAFLRVRPLWVEGDSVSTAPADVLGGATPYMLTVRWGKPDPAIELEPNDTQAAANSITIGSPIEGHVATQDDADWFVFEAPAGSAFALELASGEKHELQLESSTLKKRLIASPRVTGDRMVVPSEGRVFFVVRETSRRRSGAVERATPYVLTLQPLEASLR